MSAFNTKSILDGSPSLIPEMADNICEVFQSEGYEIRRDDLISGGADISITKGGFFKALLGMKTALKITLMPQENSIAFEAGVGIFGQQAIPSIISMFFYWPVLLTQLWGLIRQSHLEDKALRIAQSVIDSHGSQESPSALTTPPPAPGAKRFCTHCGTLLPDNAHFCSNCGSPLN